MVMSFESMSRSPPQRAMIQGQDIIILDNPTLVIRSCLYLDEGEDVGECLNETAYDINGDVWLRTSIRVSVMIMNV